MRLVLGVQLDIAATLVLALVDEAFFLSNAPYVELLPSSRRLSDWPSNSHLSYAGIA